MTKRYYKLIPIILLFFITCNSNNNEILANLKNLNTQFGKAVEKDDVQVASKIIKQGVDIDSKVLGYHESFLTLAIKKKSNKVLKLLLENNVSLEYLKLNNGIKIRYGIIVNYPMITAIEVNNYEAIIMMINAGIDINEKISEYGAYRKINYIMVAAEKGTEKTVSLLIKEGADVNLADDFGNHALNFAAFYNNYKVIPALIKAKSLLNKIDHAGRTALDHAIAEKSKEAEKVLREYGAKTEQFK